MNTKLLQKPWSYHKMNKETIKQKLLNGKTLFFSNEKYLQKTGGKEIDLLKVWFNADEEQLDGETTYKGIYKIMSGVHTVDRATFDSAFNWMELIIKTDNLTETSQKKHKAFVEQGVKVFLDMALQVCLKGI